jgi:hypothetical protein
LRKITPTDISEEEMTNGLKFESVSKIPALAIPDGKGVTKYDYSKAKEKPFAFRLDAIPELDEKPESIDVVEPFENMEEPEIGIEPETVDMETHTKMRSSLPYNSYSPLFYKFPEEVPPLRPPDKFLPNEKIDGYNQLDKGDPDTVTFIRIVDTVLDKEQRKQLVKKV